MWQTTRHGSDYMHLLVKSERPTYDQGADRRDESARNLLSKPHWRFHQRKRNMAGVFQSAGLRSAARWYSGNTGRGILTGPGINNWDFSIFKNLRFGERISTQLRMETFNVFNHTQFSGVNTTVSASGPGAPVTSATINGLGQVNSTRDPRTVQFGIKLYF